MGAIGDYVHYTAKGYLEHGITEKGVFQNWVSQKQEIFSRLAKNKTSSLNKKEKEEFEQILTGMLKNEQGDPNIAKVQQEIQQIMETHFQNSLQSIDFSTGNVRANIRRSLVVGSAKSTKNIEDLVARVNKLESIISADAMNREVPSKIKTQVKQLKNYYNTLAKELGKIKRENGQDAATAMIAERITDLREKRKLLNELIAEYAAWPATALQKGAFFEELIARAPEVARNEALKNIGEVIGTAVESVSFDRENFSSNVITQQLDEVLATTRLSPGKIDVSLTWGDKQLGISAKNYDVNYYVHVVSGSSLLFMLQDVNSDFVNHFLNLYTSHGKLKGQSSVTTDNMTLASRKGAILSEIKLILMYKALTGDNYKRSSANLFIINDSKTGTVKVFDMEEIMKKINGDQIRGIKINDKTFNEKTTLKNDWAEGSAKQRISKLLLDIHSQKVSASVEARYLQ